MTTTFPVSPILDAYRKSPEQACLDAWRYAEEISGLALGLPAMAQYVFLSWLKTQSQGSLRIINQEQIFLWLFGQHPGLAEAEYRLMLMEVSWLESFTRPFVPSKHKDCE